MVTTKTAPSLGTKRICPECATKYYDLAKKPPTCPSCGSEFDPEALLRSRRARPLPVIDDEPEAEAVEKILKIDDELVVEDELVVDDDLVEDEAEEDEDVLIEDAEELGEGDMDEVVEIADDEEER